MHVQDAVAAVLGGALHAVQLVCQGGVQSGALQAPLADLRVRMHRSCFGVGSLHAVQLGSPATEEACALQGTVARFRCSGLSCWEAGCQPLLRKQSAVVPCNAAFLAVAQSIVQGAHCLAHGTRCM